ncbi:hypothetical protein DFP72DRAFT_1069292 [Ephemerocybe angulata]|uniref:C2H2-type domain-containing protein n=1 Tax=Ephemerocybe angulata TaxID=980116 RepID=A0A8H6M3Z2_9AGAR|nr:hypothetical protein DFP72DRAFT_1069292 [Tulosesus angulatus]
MRLTLVPILLSLATSFVSAYHDHTASLHAREYIDSLAARDLHVQLSDLSTRDLIGELSERLERRYKWKCGKCKRTFDTSKGDVSASDHSC